LIKEEIIFIRKQLGLSQERFGQKLGVSRATIVNWEKGDRKPSPLALEKLIAEKNLFN
jgi:DNA-binding transcriptional regulator YiaG